jgi:hypothetical protein
MTMQYTTFGKSVLTAILLALPVTAAFAQDATAVAERIKAAAAAQGTVLEWTSVAGDASSMTMEGVSAKAANMDVALPLGMVTLSGITEQNGGYRIETTTTSPISMTSEGVTFDTSPIVLRGWNIAGENSTDPLASLSLYERLEIASMSVRMADKTVFSLTDFFAAITPSSEGDSFDFTASVAKFTGDMSGATDPQTKAALDAFGYEKVNGSYTAVGSWNLADGRLNIAQNDFTLENVGKLGFTADVGGYTIDFVKQVQEAQQKLAAQPPSQTGPSEAEIEMLGLMQQLSLNGMTIRFDDASLTGKIIDYIAQQQGQKREDIVNVAKAGLPFLLMQIQLHDMAAAISPAINAFLDEPGSIEIKAAPPQPLPFTLLGGAAMANPNDPGAAAKAIWSMLGVTVTANQP